MAETHPTEENFKEFLQKIKDNDSSLVTVNLNNLGGSKNEWMMELAQACETNTHLQSLFVANCGITTEGAKRFADVLKRNKTLLQLNLETNRIEKRWHFGHCRSRESQQHTQGIMGH